MARIFWDTNLFVYLFEGNPEFGPRVQDLRERMEQRRDQLYTSALNFCELLTGALKLNNHQAVQRYTRIFASGAILVQPFDYRAAIPYSQIRQDKRVSKPDAIQLACAAAAEVDLFITNDERLNRREIPGVKFISSLLKAPI